MPIQEQQLDSSNLKSAKYDDKNQTMEITFLNGSTYRYERVPPQIFNALTDAVSPGGYFSRQIRNSFGFEKIS